MPFDTRLTRALFFLLIAGLVPAQEEKQATKDDYLKALAEFERYIANTNEHVRRVAVDEFGTVNYPDAVPVLLDVLKDKSPLVRAGVAGALKNQKSKPALADLTRRLDAAKDELVRLTILAALAPSPPRVAYGLLLDLGKDKSYAVRILALELLGNVESEKGKSEDVLLTALKDSDPTVRLIAIESLAKLRYPKLVDLSLDLMKSDSDWRVQAVAIASLRPFRDRRTIEPLIDAMETAEGRIRDDAHQALVDITQTTYGPKPDIWRKWWDRVKGGFKVPTAEEVAAVAAKQAATDLKYNVAKETPFQAIQTKSQRMLFILDVSGSMREKLSIEGADPKRVEAFRERYAGYETKIDLAREELITTVAQLEGHVKFNIILFDTDVRLWKPSLVSAGAGTRNTAIKYLSKLTPSFIEDRMLKQNRSGTNTFGAINAAFGLEDEPQEIPTKNHKVESDTVFFLTDGMPTDGQIKDPQELLRYVEEVNGRLKMVIHVLTFSGSNKAFLSELARVGNGQYVEIRP